MPSSQASTSRYILTALAIILVITAFILVGLNAMNLDKSFGSVLSRKASQEELNESYKAGYLAAREKYLGPPLENQRSLVGVVVSNSGNSLVVRATNLDTDPIVDGVSDERTIVVSDKTMIHSASNKDPDVLAGELASNPDASPVTYQTISLQSIPVGAKVSIQSEGSLRLLQTIQATEVTLLP